MFRNIPKPIFIIVAVLVSGVVVYFGAIQTLFPVGAPDNALTTTNNASSSSISTPSDKTTATLSDPKSVFSLDKKAVGTKVFNSENLGLGFTYLPNASNGNFAVTVTELGNKIYIHKATEAPEAGQSIEVFTKDAALTLEEALKEKFLRGYDSKNCFPKTLSASLPNYAAAGILFPPSDDPNAPSKNSDKCPAYYTDSSVASFVQFFLMNKDVPGKFIFVRIGRNIIASDGTLKDGKTPYNWSHALRILK